MSASRLGVPEAISDCVRPAARLAITASPSDPPIMNAVLTTPEARPESVGFTSFIAASSSGLNEMPAAMPSSTIEGITSIITFASIGARPMIARPTAPRNNPIASGLRMPNFMTILAERPSENAAMIRLAGRNTRPIWNGVKPSTACRYSVVMKNQANMPAAHSTPIRFAALKFRSLNNVSGMSGMLRRDSMMRNAMSTTTAVPSNPSV